MSDHPVTERIYAAGLFVLESAAHFGGGDSGDVDMALRRDPLGQPLLTGTTLSGCAQAGLRLRMAGLRDLKQIASLSREVLARNDADLGKWEPALFGGHAPRPKLRQFGRWMSPLYVWDARLVGTARTAVRDSVRIEPDRGTARDEAKFDAEVVERGTEFLLRMELVFRDGDDQATLLREFRTVLELFAGGEIRVGARTRRGWGKGRVARWSVVRLDMTVPADRAIWLGGGPHVDEKEAIRELRGLLPNWLGASHPARKDGLRIEVDFELSSSLLVRSPNAAAGPDVSQLRSGDEAALPGTSLGGTLRQLIGRILAARHWPAPIIDHLITELFGKQHDGRKGRRGKGLWAGRLRVEETILSVGDAKPFRDYEQDRVAIDRFTGGAADTALFSEKPIRAARIWETPATGSPILTITLDLEEPEPAEAAVLLLSVRDLWFGHVPVGGETAIGRGSLQGREARVTYRDRPPATIREKQGCLCVDHIDWLKGAMKALENPAEYKPAASRRRTDAPV